MIQRIQTLYLMLAVAMLISCLAMPIGSVEPQGMGVSAKMFNLGLYQGENFTAYPLLLADLVITAALSLVTVFMFKRRALQMRLCTVSVVLCLLWYAYYAYCAFVALPVDGATFHVAFGACLPLIAIILLMMAHRGIKADDRLVKSMDRIR